MSNRRAERRAAEARKHIASEPMYHLGDEEGEDEPMVLIDGTPIDHKAPWPLPSNNQTKE